MTLKVELISCLRDGFENEGTGIIRRTAAPTSLSLLSERTSRGHGNNNGRITPIIPTRDNAPTLDVGRLRLQSPTRNPKQRHVFDPSRFSEAARNLWLLNFLSRSICLSLRMLHLGATKLIYLQSFWLDGPCSTHPETGKPIHNVK